MTDAQTGRALTVEEFAQVVLEQTKARLATQYSQAQADREIVQVIPGPKYTKVNIGPEHNVSGKYMVENSTGVIYGIKGYGQVHKGHAYGTLATVDQWYWGGYVGERRTDARQAVVARRRSLRTTGTDEADYKPTPQEVSKYLPRNYYVTGWTDDLIRIEGRDNAGWTLDGYVIPRLASGLITCREVEL